MYKLLQKITFVLASIISLGSFYAQDLKKESIKAPIFSVSYAGQMPLGTLANRFGLNSSIGFSGGLKTKTNFLFELEGTFMFSQNVHEDVLKPLKNSDGFVVNISGQYSAILVQERGFTETISVGKILPIIGPNPNSGLLIKLGIGTIHHKIRIDNQNNLVPELNKNKLPYYDRLTFGFLIKQYIGYYHLSSKRLQNFNFGFEFYQGITRGMRDYQIDLMGPYRDYRLDVLIGARLGWLIPIYRKTNKDFYFE
jgi:hypothetical protein